MIYHQVTVVAKGTHLVVPSENDRTSQAIGCAETPHFSAIPRFQRAALCALTVVILAGSPAFGQKSPRGGGGAPPSFPASMSPGAVNLPERNPDPFSSMESQPSASSAVGDTGRIIDAEACNSWTESGVHSPTVSAKRLAVPGKATSEYQKACGAFKGKKMPDAEAHLRKAIDLYPDYAAAWVVLGQVMQSENKKDEGRAACSKAHDLDPGYVASYLCLAEFAAIDSDWTELAKLSESALSIDPIGNAYALYYAADAGYHLKEFAQAEMHAQSAVQLDPWHHMPEVHLLLAHIYDAAGNVQMEVTQLKEFLKMAPNAKDAPQAKTTLAQIESQPAKLK